MPDTFEDGPGQQALETFRRAASAAATQAGDPLHGLIVITITGDGIVIHGSGDPDALDSETQANILCALAESFGCEVEVSTDPAGAVH
jgi:hypothetical protein